MTRKLARPFLFANLMLAGLWISSSSGYRCEAAVPTELGQNAPAASDSTVRVATFNVSLYRTKSGELARDLEDGMNQEAKKLAAVIQHVRPDILLLNEIDYEEDHQSLKLFVEKYLAIGQEIGDTKRLEPIDYPHFFAGPSNTGFDSGLDLNGDNKLGTPEDAWGYGRYPGQYSMAILSRFPIDTEKVRTFQNLRWAAMPRAMQPIDPESNQPYYPEGIWKQLRLSSKSHWDIPIQIDHQTLHLLASHPTPPAFDGAEDRNGCRNHDEIFFWKWYVDPETQDSLWIIDDSGKKGGLAPEARFVITGDLNADPVDGSGISRAIQSILNSNRVTDPRPESKGAEASTTRLGHANETHRGLASNDTAQFNSRSVGNLRVDYCLPSSNLKLIESQVFWPVPNDPMAKWVEVTDHRLVWVDVEME